MEGVSESIEVKAARLCCSFCGAGQYEVERMVAGAGSFICNGCIELCMDIIRDGRVDRVRAGEAEYLSWGGA